MKCHYEVMGVKSDITAEELKTVYKRLAMQYHPDKNLDHIDEALKSFKEANKAYEVLSDVEARARYDKYRNAILEEELAKECVEQELDVYSFFSPSCFSGFGDGPKGFYTVYRQVFEEIAKEDSYFFKYQYEFPNFGQSDSSYVLVVLEFYSFWENYFTAKTYEWVVEFGGRLISDRRAQLLIENENKRSQEQARQTRNDEVRQLVSFVKKLDKRVQGFL